MATVADLGINISADTRGVGGPVDQARAKVHDLENAAHRAGQSGKHAFESMHGGLRGFSESLHHSMASMRDFNAVLELGFGMRIGRMIFEKIHEGVVHLAEGFSEAQSAGEGFWESLGEGISKMVGLETHLEEVERHLETLKEFNKTGREFSDIMEKWADEKEAKANPELFSDTRELEKMSAEIQKEATEKRKGFGDKSLTDKMTELKQLEMQLDTLNKMDPATRWLVDFGQSTTVKDKVEALRKEVSGPMVEHQRHEEQLAQAQKMADDRKLERVRESLEKEAEEEDKFYEKQAEKEEERAEKLAKAFRTPLEKARDTIRDLEEMKDRISPEAYQFHLEETAKELRNTQKDKEKEQEKLKDWSPKSGVAAAQLGTSAYTSAIMDFKRSMSNADNVAAQHLEEARKQTAIQQQLVQDVKQPPVQVKVASIL